MCIHLNFLELQDFHSIHLCLVGQSNKLFHIQCQSHLHPEKMYQHQHKWCLDTVLDRLDAHIKFQC